jgi:DNA-binding NarL/FixJ family response regulator
MPAFSDAHRHRLLIADDDSLVRSTMSMFAMAAGFEVVGVAEDGEQSVELASVTQPDVALLDVDMPSGGLSAVQGILEVSPATAIVLLSNDELETEVRALLLAGASAYCRKGVSPEVLADMLTRSIHARAGEPQQQLQA